MTKSHRLFRNQKKKESEMFQKKCPDIVGICRRDFKSEVSIILKLIKNGKC